MTGAASSCWQSPIRISAFVPLFNLDLASLYPPNFIPLSNPEGPNTLTRDTMVYT
jgi:hypothetical protein